MYPLACGGITTLRSPSPVKNLAPLEKNQAYTTNAGAGVKKGWKSVTSCLVVLG